MLKGVNHKVIEVNRPDSLYFERAVFYLRPEADDIPTHAALRETEQYFTGQMRRRSWLRRWLWFLLGAAASAGAFALAGKLGLAG
ncbi:MAG: hypothetical protein II916_10995 [Oscillospiraceae bacterium]|nr:hypothetical protein [Oscillospiraceae bacterium]